MRVDFYLPPTPPHLVTPFADRAAALGYDGIFSADVSHDPFLQLVPASLTQPDMEIGTAIAVAFARSPMTVAYAAWDLAAMSQGRFILGLGSQIKAHITRRFDMPWGSPGPRMRDYIAALRAIWDSWQSGTRLKYEGDFYSHTLMTPFFNPGPIGSPDIPVYIAGVGEYMSRLAGEVCDGFHAHPFHTVRYLDEVVLAKMAEGAVSAGRLLSDIEVASVVFVVSGRDEAELASMKDAVRLQIAFYASTPAYRGVLELHGWDFGPTLTAMSKRGDWAGMAAVIDDEVLEEVAVVAEPDDIGDAIRRRYGTRLQRIGFYTPPGLPLGDEEMASLIEALRR